MALRRTSDSLLRFLPSKSFSPFLQRCLLSSSPDLGDGDHDNFPPKKKHSISPDHPTSSSSSSLKKKKVVKSEDDDDPDSSMRKKKKNPSKANAVPSSAVKDPDSLLVKSLKKQINEVTELASKFQTEVRGSFKPFEVVKNEQNSDLTLRRIIGKEEILVKCLLDLENPHVEGHEEDASSDSDDDLKISQCLTLNVEISKDSSKENQPRIAFLCSYAKGETIVIEDIAYLGASIHQKYPYSGPCFQDLNDNLKQIFQNVLKTRGINSSLADTIMEYLTNQYQDEYIDWLKRVRDFLIQ